MNSNKLWKIKANEAFENDTREFLNLQKKGQRTGFPKESAIA
jgi:hypothetical protein